MKRVMRMEKLLIKCLKITKKYNIYNKIKNHGTFNKINNRWIKFKH